ncbi:MAG: hypothetical protein A3F84_12725 [Candidatus Handelsmanbacteria bacterium RIFCSPLOWO2_12_FULL_64_10]|uniref:Uncharacterized protein n=1 Tax=Handelsmanbacteria sp. (strain RIFCSPLOWO2_12_FULL_64_10) TaxID=1817868 RepID=A0A1F6CWB0_HANXR|nr:MAG: hypothetical protein A3F84_12725 [Candidatus Handelsmanbacteria bacterium RIFCSPLOWO2_12_FULL_64_10]
MPRALCGVVYILLMPLTGQEDARFAVTQPDPRSRHRLRVSVATSRFRHEYAVDCLKGDVTKVDGKWQSAKRKAIENL